MQAPPRNPPGNDRFRASLLDSAVRRFARPALGWVRAIHTFPDLSTRQTEPSMIKLITTAAAALTFLAAASAQAETRGLKMLSMTLAYRTQDIANPTGAEKMLSRIDSAARRLCASTSPVVRRPDAQARLCQAKTVARAVDTLAAPLVTAVYQGRQVEVATR